MNFQATITTCMGKHATFSGRASRRGFCGLLLGVALVFGQHLPVAHAEEPPVIGGKLDLKGAQIGMTAKEFLDVLHATPAAGFIRNGDTRYRRYETETSVTFQGFDPATEKITELEQQGDVLDLANLPGDGNYLASGQVSIFGSAPGHGAHFTAAFLDGKLRFMTTDDTDGIPGRDDPSQTHALVDALAEKFHVAPMLSWQPVNPEKEEEGADFLAQWRDSEGSVLSVVGGVSGPPTARTEHGIDEITMQWKGWDDHMAAMKAGQAKRQQAAEDQVKQARKSDL